MTHDFFIKQDGKFFRIAAQEVLYIEALANYVRIFTAERSYLLLSTMANIEKELPASLFCRVHRSYIVSLAHVQSFDRESVQVNDKEIPVGPRFSNVLPGKVKVLSGEDKKQVVQEN